MEDNDDNKDEDFHGDTTESDKDYLGSDDDTGRMAIDDPDDFVYRPGKRAPKRKAPVKRPQRSTGTKRKRGSSALTFVLIRSTLLWGLHGERHLYSTSEF